ncbi:hypothetical protein D5086_029077 [Populus alba]|uniref:Uncharacterized protein n=1 Tax=Populus alba TaxID=43335 RepID=A0ACC4ASG2_POPAL
MERRNLRKSSSEEESLSLASSGSKSCASSLTIDGSWFQEIRAHKLRIVAFVSRFHETKLKVVRRRHSEVNRSSGHQRAVVLASPEKAAALVASTESGGDEEDQIWLWLVLHERPSRSNMEAAVKWLLKQKAVKRSGEGGSHDHLHGNGLFS